jgi:hypothetical protein
MAMAMTMTMLACVRWFKSDAYNEIHIPVARKTLAR